MTRWTEQVYAAKQAKNSGVVRRSLRWIEKSVGLDKYIADAKNRGYHPMRAYDQTVVICANGNLEVL